MKLSARIYMLTMLMAIVCLGMKAQAGFTISVPDITAQIGQAQLPVSVQNSGDVVALQFDITLPDGMTAQTAATLTNRCDDHVATVRNTGGQNYRVVLVSPSNRPIRGQSGVLLYIPVTVSSSFGEGDECQVSISGVVLSDAGGDSITTQVEVGTITIAKLPDLAVKSVAMDRQQVAPGDTLQASWQVENVGAMPTGGGWTEQLSLVSEADGTKMLVSTTYYDKPLQAGAVVNRQAEVVVPAILGIDGEARLEVTLMAGEQTGESASAQGNNTALSEALYDISKVLSLVLSPNRVDENGKERITAKLQRSGSRGMAETFALTATADSRISLPATITIPAGQSARWFYFDVADNDEVDDYDVVELTAQGNDYAPATARLTIDDNEYPELTLTASKSVVGEGETFQLTVTASRPSADPIVVTLSSENARRFNFPSQLTIAAGETEVTTDVTAIDDDLPSLQLSNAFTASAQHYVKGEVIVILNDDDMPLLELTLTPNVVQESAGPVAIAGILRRTTHTNSKITVKLSDDSNGCLFFDNQTLELAKGVEEVHFNFGPVDNALVDGDRTYTVTAAVWVSSCSCSATGTTAGSVSATLSVLDNDGPALSLTASQGTLKEGGSTTITVTRNTNANGPLVVSVESDYDDNLDYNNTVTIPAGETSATIEVTALENSTQGDSHVAVFKAKADGYSTGTCSVLVTDQTLPDARITSIAADQREAEIGSLVKLTVDVQNDGAAALPAELPVKFYLRGNGNPVATVYTDKEIGIGQSLQITCSFTLKDVPGVHDYFAVVNEGGIIQELTLTNNTSESVSINVSSPYSIAISTDKAVYKQGEKVVVTGQLTGSDIAETSIDLYIVNEGTRQAQTVKTDADGSFSYEWQLYALQSGHFALGACYPGENKSEAMASFDVYGLRRVDNNYITCEVVNGETFSGSLDLINPGQLDLTGCSVEVLSAPETCQAQLNVPSMIAGGETIQLSYALTGITPSAEMKWEEIKARVNTSEGATLDVTFYFYCRHATGKLVASTQHIETTMVKGQTREYLLEVTNIGKGETGAISLSLPSFMRSLTGNALPSLGQNDTLTVALALVHQSDMELNVPVRGQLGINCENGDGTFVTFTVTPVSNVNGTLIVDVCDEYTYHTAEAPHVKGAAITIQNPATQAIVWQGETGENGRVQVELPEGRYTVLATSSDHDSYKNTIVVDPERETLVTVNLSISTVKVTYTVEPTEIEDRYVINTTVTYETNVPAPVVVIDGPTSIDGDNMQEGESVLVNLVMTNKGLITALNVRFQVPEPSEEWDIRLLDMNDPFDLAPQQSVVFPIIFTKLGHSSSARKRVPDPTMAACMAGFHYWYDENCGKDLKTNKAAHRMALKTCAWTAIFQTLVGGIGGGGGMGGPGGGGGGKYTAETYREGDFTSPMCDPDLTRCAEGIIEKLMGEYPGAGPILDKVNEAANHAINASNNGGKLPPEDLADIGESLADDLEDLADKLHGGGGIESDLAGAAEKIYGIFDACSGLLLKYAKHKPVPRRGQVIYYDTFEDAIKAYSRQIDLLDSIAMEIYGDGVWYNEYSNDKKLLFRQIGMLDNIGSLTEEDLASWKPSSVTTDQFSRLIERWSDTNPENKIDWPLIKQYANIIAEMDRLALLQGYQSVAAIFTHQLHETYESLNDATDNICSSVKLELSQTMTFTRQAFRGTLQVTNGSETEQMKNVRLSLRVVNNLGTAATEREFQMTLENLEGFEGTAELDNEWTLDANSTGTAKILFIPTRYAAQEEPEEWLFGGTLYYTDPFSGLEMTRELYPVTLTVKPSPVLDLTYFMQRDIYGDDPLTLDVVEPVVPAEFALLINNKGNGDATNVNMVTQQPKIIDNEKGLMIDFEIVSSQVNGGEANLALGQSITNDFGTITAHEQAYAQWWLTSSLLGHFINYDVTATHVTSYGNENLSLLDHVTIHELIHSLEVADGDKTLRGFMVNDIADADNLPDMLYLTNGDVLPVGVAASVEVSRTSATECVVTVRPSEAGWVYGNMADPTYGASTVKSIVRQGDGKEIAAQNFWQTDRTLRDGKDWLYENRLHFADLFADGSVQTYVVTFEPAPETLLNVDSITGVPADGTLATAPLDKIGVHFNKAVDPQTFTADDLTLAVQGTKQDISTVAVSTDDNKTFTLDFTALNEQLSNGYYVLTVNTADITDHEGFHGKNGKQTGWVMYRGGLVQLLTSAYPQNAGSVSRQQPGASRIWNSALSMEKNDDTATYGDVVVLTAEPAEGYEFSYWSLNGEKVSADPQYTTTALGDMDVVANFVKKTYLVSITADDSMGAVKGMGTGIYEHGTQIDLTAEPRYDYAFKEWLVDGQPAGDSPTLSLTIEGAADVEAVFVREYYYQTLALARGWNWVSGWLTDPLPVSTLAESSNRIVSQTAELVRDPQLGMVGTLQELLPGQAYKVQAASTFTSTLRGHASTADEASLQLYQGWNWIGYPSSEARPLSAIANASEGDYITSQTGFAEYGSGSWEGTMTELTPGQGYLYKSADEKQLSFSFTEAAGSRTYGTSEANEAHGTHGAYGNYPLSTINYPLTVDPHRYPSTMNITARIYREGMELPAEQYTVYAFAGDELRGVSQPVGQRSADGRLQSKNHYLTVYGDEAVSITFIVEDSETGQQYNATPELTFVSDVVGSRKQPFAVNIGSATGVDLQGDNSRPMTVYTLSGVLVSRDATLKQLRRLPKGVYIVRGQKCFVQAP